MFPIQRMGTVKAYTDAPQKPDELPKVKRRFEMSSMGS